MGITSGGIDACKLVRLFISLVRGFILAFIIFIIIAIINLILNNIEKANKIVEYAYYSLVMGIIFAILSILLEKRILKRCKSNNIDNLKNMINNFNLKMLIAKLLVGTGSVSSILILSSALDLVALPGRPTLIATTDIVHAIMRLGIIGSALGYLGLMYLGGYMLGFLGILLIILFLFLKIEVIVIIIVLLYIVYFVIYDNISIIAVYLIIINILIFISLFNNFVGFIAWGMQSGSMLLGLLLGFAGYGGLFLLRDKVVGSRHVKLSGYRAVDSRSLDILLFVVGLFIAVFSIIYPHLRFKDSIISLDTIFNIKECKRLYNGEIRILYTWSRPLYMLATCLPALVFGVNLYVVYDIVVPLIGFVTLVVAIYVLAARAELDRPWRGVAAVLAATYWTPFFVYAGLQTNLLALPVAYLLISKLIEKMFINSYIDLFVVVAAIFLGAWHPWTLAYFTVSAVAALLLSGREVKGVKAMMALLPGWLVHVLVSMLAGSSAVALTAVESVVQDRPLLWYLKIFMWGTGLRGDIVLPLGLILFYVIVNKRMVVSPKNAWILVSAAPMFFGVFLRDAVLFFRLMIDAPLPLLLPLLLQNYVSETAKSIEEASRLERLLIGLLVAASTLVWLYYTWRLAPVVVRQ